MTAGVLDLVVVILSGVLVLDVVLELWRITDRCTRRRELEHDRAEMRRTLRRTGGQR